MRKNVGDKNEDPAQGLPESGPTDDVGHAGFRDRLKELMEPHRSVSQFARKVGITEGTVRNWLADDGSEPNRAFLLKVAKAVGVTVGWLAAGEEPRSRFGQVTAGTKSSGDLADDFVMIPRYDVAASAGGGAIIESDRLVDFLAFRTDWIRRTLALDPKRLAVISAEGDSMRPTIAEGDVLLVDTNIHHVRDSAIYVLQLAGVLLVKRVRIRLDGGVDVISDNPAYATETVAQRDLERLAIAGRVVWHGGLV